MKVLHSKLTLPEPAQHVVLRSRLINEIQSQDKVSLIALHAPAGFGKTVVALQTISRVPKKNRGWYHLDEGDRSPRRFLAYFAEALPEAINPRRHAIDGAAVMNSGEPVAGLLDDICFLLEEYRGRACWLVLDNWEIINESLEISEIVSKVLFHSRGKLKLIVTSRVIPSFRLRRLIEHGQAICLEQQNLAFNYNEFVEIAKVRSNGDLDSEELEQLWRFTEGWCVCVGLVLDSLENDFKFDRSALYRLGNSTAIQNYIEEELLRSKSENLREFISRCSLLDEMSVDSCCAVGYEAQTAKDNLRSLLASSIPHVKLGRNGTVRLHPLVRIIGKRILKEQASNEDLRQIFHAAARYYSERETITQSIEMLLEISDVDAALRELDVHMPRLRANFHLGSIHALMDLFPKQTRKHITFIANRGSLLLHEARYEEVSAFLGEELKEVSSPESRRDLASAWGQYYYARTKLSTKPMYARIEAAWQDFNKRLGPFEGKETLLFEDVKGFSAFIEGRFEIALKHVRAMLILDKKDYFYIHANSTNKVAYLSKFLGRTQTCIDDLDRNYQECIGRDYPAHVTDTLAIKADILITKGLYREGLQTIGDCEELMFHRAIWVGSHANERDQYRGVAYWYLGNRKDAIESLRRAHKRLSEASYEQKMVSGILLEYYTMLSDTVAVDVDLGGAPDSGFGLVHLFYQPYQAVRALLSEKWEDMRTHGAELIRISTRCGALPWQVTGNFILAYWAHKTGNEKRLRHHLKAGLELLERIDWQTYPMANAILTGFVFVKACKHGILSQVAKRLVTGQWRIDLAPALEAEFSSGQCSQIEASRLIEVATRLQVRGLTGVLARLEKSTCKRFAPAISNYRCSLEKAPLPPLEIHTLGRFQVLVNGKSVSFPRPIVRHFFQILLAYYPDPVHEEIVLELLWPETEPRRGKAKLYPCVSHVRKALDPYRNSSRNTYIECKDNHYRLILPEGSVYDCDVVLSAVTAIIPLAGKINPLNEKELKTIYKALCLYKGDFLMDQPYDRAISDRRNLVHQRYQQALLTFAQLMTRGNDTWRALELLESGIQLDRLWRDGVAKLMQLYVENSNTIKALRLYRDYEKRIQEELDLPPDEELREYFESLVRPEQT